LYFFAIASMSSMIFLLISSRSGADSAGRGRECRATRFHVSSGRGNEFFRDVVERKRRPRSSRLVRRRGACRLTLAMSSDEARAAETATGVSQDARFALELEFVMSLANPRYIHHLAKEKFLDDPSFVAYLDYLQYWREPAYARFLHYPHALYFLGQLQRPEFRKAMANPRAAEHVFSQQFFHWQRSRTEQLARASAEAGEGM
jgi:mediator of RNA polymerase II transcription subunit 31